MLERLTRLFEPTPRTAEAWLVRMGRAEVSARDLEAFETWLDAEPSNLDAYQALKATHRQTRELKSALTAEIAAIPTRPTLRKRPGWPVIAGPAVAVLTAAILTITLWPGLSPFGPTDPMSGAVTYRTTVGEVRDVRLADGSTVTLDTGSIVRVALHPDTRQVVVERGQAYFQVSHNPDRPFRVDLADRTVVVTGTRFVTALNGDAARVTLLEGAVHLVPTSGKGFAFNLSPGDAVVYEAGRPVRLAGQVDPVEAAPWRQRRLVFRDATLSDALAELSRYTPVRLVADDPALARQRVTAVFPLEGEGSVVDRIDALFPVTITPSGPGSVVVHPE